MMKEVFAIPRIIKNSVKGLDDDNRWKIIETLINDGGMSYTALKNKIELDNKGLFNYHLGKLLKSGIIERFEYIGKKNGDRSYYDISQLGKRVINGLLSTMDYSDLEPANIQTDSPIVINTSIKNKMSIPKISSSVFVWMKTNPIFSSKLNDEDNIEYIDGSNAIEKPIQVIVTE